MIMKSVPALFLRPALFCALFCALFAALALSASTADADARLLPGNTLSGRSGSPTASITELGAPSNIYALFHISWDEDGDSPCAMRATKSEINGSGDIYSNDFTGCTYWPSESKSVGWPYDSGIFVTGLAVCTNAGSDRLKGIQLFGGVVLSNGVLVPGAPPMITQNPNCNTWHPPVFCPAGHVATKLRVHHTGDEIRALSLACREVAPM
jgi:hypothetical protein